ncbi:MAG TPA: TatD family nuclease-associated radical SAM protein [Candidatus Gastranaerophilaceae bacterium]|nr:TatD family nuclease-associated radical SAM protein [Candidatus Gastranaerophilaceae bacterium]HPT41800.1 TatD family nuclease-associated radical SAM protein [Candidatus Gastranaerophilaceae bacterium]
MAESDEQNLVYLLDGKIYINLTNKCTANCVFCIRSLKDDVCGANLRLKNENFGAQEVIDQLKKLVKNEREIIFCGYGEPTLKLDILKEVANFLKTSYNNVKLRINTNGHANCVYKRNIIPELKGLIDEISVSLNASNKEQYEELTQPKLPCENPFEEVKDFIKKSVEEGIETTVTVVNGYKNHKIDLNACEKIAQDLGANFRVRQWLDEGY